MDTRYIELAKAVTTALDELYVPLLDHEAAWVMLQESLLMSVPGHPQWNLCLIGPSGTGKSYLAKRLRDELNRTLPPGSDEIPVLIVDTPENPTLERMVDAVLTACNDEFAGKGEYKDKMRRLPLALAKRKVRIIIFDEFQQLFDGKTPKQSRIAAQWLKGLVNRKLVPIVLAGLESIQEAIATSAELKRRFTRYKSLKAYSMAVELDISQLNKVLMSISPLVKQEKTASLRDKHMLLRLWLASGGILDYVFKMAKSAVLAAYRADLKGLVSLDHWSEAFVELQNELEKTGGINPFDIKLIDVKKHVARLCPIAA
jgi:hypothetical protein